jgi:TonB family protein
MKKNRVFWGMLGLSAALHGLALAGVSGDQPRAPALVTEVQSVSTLKMIKTGTRPRQPTPAKSPEKRIVEKSVEPPPETIPVEETSDYEDTQNDGLAEYTGEAEGGDDNVNDQDSGAITEREYAALLVYIRDFISKNLVYPAMAKRRNIEGIVGVSFEIESAGGLDAVTVAHSSGSSILDNAAVSLIKKIPPLKNLTLNRTLALNVNIAYELTE